MSNPNMPSPVANGELRRHLDTERAKHIDPNSPHFVGSENAPLHAVTYDVLQERIDSAVEPLVVEKDGEHALSEALERDMDNVYMSMESSIREVERAIMHPQYAREVLWEDYNRRPTEFTEAGVNVRRSAPDKQTTDTANLNLDELKRFIHVKREDIADSSEESGGELELIAWSVVDRMVDHWKQQHDTAGMRKPESRVQLEYGKAPRDSPNVHPVERHLRRSRIEFGEMTTEKIKRLGEVVTSAAGARVQQPKRGFESSGMGMDDAKIREAQQAIAEVNVSGRRSGSEATSGAQGTEHETALESREAYRPLVEQISRAAEGRTIIHTDLSSTMHVRHGSQETALGRGFRTFGDGARGDRGELPDYLFSRINGNYGGIRVEGEPPKDMIETVVFQPAVEVQYEAVTEEHSPGWGRKKKETVRRQQVGEQPLMIVNPQTGQQERGVYFDYAYNPAGLQGPRVEDKLDLPHYQETAGPRTGNMLIVRALLPESAAAQLRAAIENNPEVVRDTVHSLVRERGGLSEAAWHGSAGDGPVRPPYGRLPIYMADPPSNNESAWAVQALRTP